MTEHFAMFALGCGTGAASTAWVLMIAHLLNVQKSKAER